MDTPSSAGYSPTAMDEDYRNDSEPIPQRTELFAVSHAILLAAFFAAPSPPAHMVISTLGLVTSSLWLLVGARQYLQMVKLIGAARRPHSRELQWLRFVRAVPALAVLTPLAFLATWLALDEQMAGDLPPNWRWSRLGARLLALGLFALFSWAQWRVERDAAQP